MIFHSIEGYQDPSILWESECDTGVSGSRQCKEKVGVRCSAPQLQSPHFPTFYWDGKHVPGLPGVVGKVLDTYRYCVHKEPLRQGPIKQTATPTTLEFHIYLAYTLRADPSTFSYVNETSGDCSFTRVSSVLPTLPHLPVYTADGLLVPSSGTGSGP